jgi:hypothetical protein
MDVKVLFYTPNWDPSATNLRQVVRQTRHVIPDTSESRSPLIPRQLLRRLDKAPERLSMSITIWRNGHASGGRHLMTVVEPAVLRQRARC